MKKQPRGFEKLMQNYPDNMDDLPEEPFYRDLREFDLFKDVETKT